MLPSISICIPAYKRTDYIKRLLDSVSIQTYKNFEVIITDDSPDNSIEELCASYTSSLPIKYFKNLSNLNTPENWNEATRKASFEWIKLMHDDDWFSDKDSLLHFAEAIQQNPRVDFIFSAYSNVYDGTELHQSMHLSAFWRFALKQNAEILISRNVFGPPSVTLCKRNAIEYDRSMKYVVDIDFYCTYMQQSSWCYLNQSLINVGINEAQVTKYTFGVAEVQLKESLLMLEKKNPKIFNNVLVYDGWWRMIRNFKIKKTSDIHAIGYSERLPYKLNQMIFLQSFLPQFVLKVGVFSKLSMFVAYLVSRISFSNPN
jgi:glycosyltransferase involved in cell wall biosynthesis